MAKRPEDWDVVPGAGGGEAEAVIDCLDRAAVLMRRDRLRRGNMVNLPARGEAVVLGDLHGDLENLERAVEWAALQCNRDRYLILQELIHAGPPDGRGGELSFRALERAAALKCRFRSQVQMVLSNHDLAEVAGTEITRAKRPVRKPFRRGIENAYGPAWKRVHAAYVALLASLPLAVRTPNGVFISHSTPGHKAMADFDFSIFDRPLARTPCGPGTSLYDFTWNRNYCQCCADRFARSVGAEILVTGHQASMPGVKTPTTRHIVLQSDGPLGRLMLLPLGVPVLHGALSSQVMKVRALRP